MAVKVPQNSLLIDMFRNQMKKKAKIEELCSNQENDHMHLENASVEVVENVIDLQVKE